MLMPIAIVLGLLIPGVHELSIFVRWLLGSMLFLAFLRPIPQEEAEEGRTLSRKIASLSFWMAAGFFLVATLMKIPKPIVVAVVLLLAAPTATAAPGITSQLGGRPGRMLWVVLIGHLSAILSLPLWIAVLQGYTGIDAMTQIAIQVGLQVGLVVLLPMILAWLVRNYWPILTSYFKNRPQIAMWLWAAAVFIVVAKSKHDAIALDLPYLDIAQVAAWSLVFCLVQFWLGHRLGKSMGFAGEGAQALGQKNTLLMIWLAQTWFGGLVPMGALTYVIWQNLVLSWLLTKSKESK